MQSIISQERKCDFVVNHQNKKCDLGILISGSGFGMAMIANKFRGLRSVDCFNEDGAKRAKAHYNANVLAIKARNEDTINKLRNKNRN